MSCSMQGLSSVTGLALFMLCATPSASTAWDELPSNRDLGSIFNDDEASLLERLWDDEMTPEQYRKAIDRLLDAKPGVLAMCVGLPDPVWYTSQVASMIDQEWPKHYQTERAGCFSALRKAGTDPLKVAIEASEAKGIPFVASYRMNSEDHGGKQLDIYAFGAAHKEWQIPGAHCLDPAVPEVFEHRMAIFREVVSEYDIDGIEFDFRRWWNMVSNPEVNHVVLIRMVRETRRMLDAVAKKKGRGRLLLGMWVGPSIDTAAADANYPGMGGAYANPSCRGLGIDVQTWVKDELVDDVCPTLFWPQWPGLPYTREFGELAEGSDAGIYPTLLPIPSWIKDGPIEPDDTERLIRYKNEFFRHAIQIYADGADEVSTFNWTPHMEVGLFRNPGRMNPGVWVPRAFRWNCAVASAVPI